MRSRSGGVNLTVHNPGPVIFLWSFKGAVNTYQKHWGQCHNYTTWRVKHKNSGYLNLNKKLGSFFLFNSSVTYQATNLFRSLFHLSIFYETDTRTFKCQKFFFPGRRMGHCGDITGQNRTGKKVLYGFQCSFLMFRTQKKISEFSTIPSEEFFFSFQIVYKINQDFFLFRIFYISKPWIIQK